MEQTTSALSSLCMVRFIGNYTKKGKMDIMKKIMLTFTLLISFISTNVNATKYFHQVEAGKETVVNVEMSHGMYDYHSETIKGNFVACWKAHYNVTKDNKSKGNQVKLILQKKINGNWKNVYIDLIKNYKPIMYKKYTEDNIFIENELYGTGRDASDVHNMGKTWDAFREKYNYRFLLKNETNNNIVVQIQTERNVNSENIQQKIQHVNP